jgi:hypothetical protein
MRWLVFDHVDPELGLTARERRAIRGRAFKLLHGHRQTWASAPRSMKLAWIAMVLVPAASGMAPWIMLQITGSWRLMLPLGILLQVLVLWIAMAWLSRWTWRPLVTRALREAGYPVCESCGYRLVDASATPRCSECGREQSAAAQVSDGA